jgi:hypothetical protein
MSDEPSKPLPERGRKMPGPAPFEWEKHTAEENEIIRRRQRSRARVTALLLGALVILFFFISIEKIRSGTP